MPIGNAKHRQNPLLFAQRVNSNTILVTPARLFDILQLFYLHQNNIVPDLAYIPERDDVFFLPPEDSTQASRPRNNQVGNTAVFRIELHIAHKAQLFTVTDVDDFFFFKSKIRIDHIRNETSLL